MDKELILNCDVVSTDSVVFNNTEDGTLTIEVFEETNFIELDTTSVTKLQIFLDYFWEVQIDKI